MYAEKPQQEVSKDTELSDKLAEDHYSQVNETAQFKSSGIHMVQKVERPATSTPNQTGMPERLKTGLENLSGFDLSPVRVHYNSPKPRQIGALAYTQGSNIHIGPGQQKHLPHEGWHVVQQMQGRVKPKLQTKGFRINDDKSLEREADSIGDEVERDVSNYPENSWLTNVALNQIKVIQGFFNIRFAAYMSKHMDQNRSYLMNKVDENLKCNEYLYARASAFLLDHDLDNWQLMKGYLNKIDEKEGKGVGGAVDQVVSKMTSINQLRLCINNYIKKKNNSAFEPSTIIWGEMQSGMGTEVTADLKYKGHPNGSDAGGSQPWMEKLQHRADDKKTLYVRGHLLNRHLGGPGLDYNMVPLTGRSGWHGANHANEIHSDLVEEQVKKKYEAMNTNGRKKVTSLQYIVIVKWGRSVRNAAGEVKELTNKFNELIDQEYKKLINLAKWNLGTSSIPEFKTISVLTENDIKNNAELRNLIPKGNIDISLEQFKEMLIRKILKENEVLYFKEISSWPIIEQNKFVSLIDSLDSDLLSLLVAVSSDEKGDWKKLEIEGIISRLRANLKLWQLEDAIVPKHIEVEAKWERNGKTEGIPKRVIQIDLVDEFDAAFNARKNLY